MSVNKVSFNKVCTECEGRRNTFRYVIGDADEKLREVREENTQLLNFI